MKVKIEKESRKWITLEEVSIAREIITAMKEDESTIEDYAEMAINAAYDGKVWNIEVFKASAKIARNARAWNAYNDHSEKLDIWIEATAYISCYNGYEFIMIGAYLSDIWQTSYDNYQEMASYMYIRRFKEVK